MSDKRKPPSDSADPSAQFGALFTHSSDAVLISSKTGEVRDANPAACALFGYEPREWNGLSLVDLVSEQDRGNTKDLAVAPPGAWFGEILARRKDGSVFSAEARSFRATFGGEELTCVGIRDTTERDRIRRQLIESEHQYRKTLDALPLAIHVIDREYRVLLLNERFRGWADDLGIQASERGTSLWKLFPFLAPEIREEYERVWKSGAPMHTDEENLIGGRTVRTRTLKIPLLENGDVTRIVTVIEDITNLKK